MNRILAYSAPKGEEWANNIGDYVQGLAANQFMHTSEWVDREQLHVYNGKLSKVIMNGWFMEEPLHFPPSEKIVPLFVSFHINPKIADRMLSPASVAYLRDHAPIGCRDEETVKILQRHGIPAYFSACLTLTLGHTYRANREEDRKGICFVDPFIAFKGKDVWRGWHWFLLHPIMCVAVYLNMRKQMFRDQPFTYRMRMVMRIGVFLRSFSRLFEKKVLMRSQYLSQLVNAHLFKGHKDAADYADRLLRYYASCKMCVTPRIHCALPCLGMGVPVVFVNAENSAISDGRFGGLIQFFNVAIAHPCGLEPKFAFENDDGASLIGERTRIPICKRHKEYASRLIEKCREFASSRI